MSKLKIEKNTYFELQKASDVLRVYEEDETRFNNDLEDLLTKFKNGHKYLRSDKRGILELDEKVVQGTRKVPNPFYLIDQDKPDVEKIEFQDSLKGDMISPDFEDVKDIEVEVEDVSSENVTDTRLNSIITLNEFVGLEIETNLLQQLVHVLDLERKHGTKITLDQMLELRKVCQEI